MAFKCYYTVLMSCLLFPFIATINSRPNCKFDDFIYFRLCRVVDFCVFCEAIIVLQGIVYRLNLNDTKECCSSIEKQYSLPPIYCYPGNGKSVFNVFQTVTVELLIEKPNDFLVYHAVNQHGVEEQMVSDINIMSFNKIFSYFWKQKDFNLNPYQSSCFGIKTDSNFIIKIRSIANVHRAWMCLIIFTALDNRKLAIFIVGLLLFSYSDRLSGNSLFYYLCAITISIATSFFVIIMLVGRLIPKKKLLIGYLGASCMLSIYIIRIVTGNIDRIWAFYYKYVLIYIVLSLLASFVICYRYKPMTNPRSINLIKWTLQLLGLALVMLSSFHVKAMICVNITSILFYYINFSLPFGVAAKYKPKRRLSSMEEYVQTSVIETPQMLEDVQKTDECPNCDTVENQPHDPITTEAVEEHDEESKAIENESN